MNLFLLLEKKIINNGFALYAIIMMMMTIPNYKQCLYPTPPPWAECETMSISMESLYLSNPSTTGRMRHKVNFMRRSFLFNPSTTDRMWHKVNFYGEIVFIQPLPHRQQGSQVQFLSSVQLIWNKHFPSLILVALAVKVK